MNHLRNCYSALMRHGGNIKSVYGYTGYDLVGCMHILGGAMHITIPSHPNWWLLEVSKSRIEVYSSCSHNLPITSSWSH